MSPIWPGLPEWRWAEGGSGKDASTDKTMPTHRYLLGYRAANEMMRLI